MTPTEALRTAARAEDEAGVRSLLAGLSEADRTELIPAARELVAAEAKKGIAAAGHLGPALLIAYGVLPLTDIRKLGWRAGHLPSRLDEVLRNRSTERLMPIVEYLLDDVSQGAWPVVRTLVRDQVVPRPDRPSYTIAMLAATRWRDAADLVAADPGLLDVEAWRLFEVEGGGEDSLANHEKFFGDTWGNVFRNLASRDVAARQRLLDVSLDALARDFATYRAGWFSRFHETLAPNDDERVARAERYLGLLRSRVGPTVSFAVAALVRIERAGGLPPDAFLDRIGPVLGEGSAGTAKAGLRLVASAGRGSAELARKAAIVAADALTHAAPDVQKSAIALIGELVTEPDEAVAGAVAHRLQDVVASQRSAVALLIARLGVDGATLLPAPTALAARAPAARKASPAERGPSAVRRPSPVEPDRAIEPLATIESLVDVAVSVLETGEPADDVERVLDAVGRLSADRSDDRARLARAIAKRARVILVRRESRPFTGHDPRADIAGVLLAWAGGELVDPSTDRGAVDPGPGAFLSARAYEVACAVAASRSFSSVAAPTHTGGWIEPAQLVRRLRTHQPASKLDLAAAILRLAPDGWDEARIMAADLAGEVGAVVRYALGGEERIGSTAAWWVAAARVRAPGHDDVAVEKRHSGLGPDAGRAARIRMKLVQKVGNSPVSPAGLGLEIEPPLAATVGVDLPTVRMLHDPSVFYWTGSSGPAMFRWIATIQPGHREAWSAIGALLLGRNVDWWSAEWANRSFLEPFIDPVTPVGSHARTLIGIALGAKEAGERGMGADVVRAALADGRMDASTLAEGLTAAAAAGCDRPNRWAVSLADVAAASEEHAVAVAEAIGGSLNALADRPAAKLVPLLRLLDELLAGTGGGPTEDARRHVEALATSGGQAGRLARSIGSRS